MPTVVPTQKMYMLAGDHSPKSERRTQMLQCILLDLFLRIWPPACRVLAASVAAVIHVLCVGGYLCAFSKALASSQGESVGHKRQQISSLSVQLSPSNHAVPAHLEAFSECELLNR